MTQYSIFIGIKTAATKFPEFTHATPFEDTPLYLDMNQILDIGINDANLSPNSLTSDLDDPKHFSGILCGDWTSIA